MTIMCSTTDPDKLHMGGLRLHLIVGTEGGMATICESSFQMNLKHHRLITNSYHFYLLVLSKANYLYYKKSQPKIYYPLITQGLEDPIRINL